MQELVEVEKGEFDTLVRIAKKAEKIMDTYELNKVLMEANLRHVLAMAYEDLPAVDIILKMRKQIKETINIITEQAP